MWIAVIEMSSLFIRQGYNKLLIMNAKAYYPHRKFKLSVGDIYLDTRKAKLQPPKAAQKPQQSDPFISYKESFPLPLFKHDKHNTIDIKRRLRSLESRPNRYKVGSKMRSQTIVADDLESNFIRKELCSLNLGEGNDQTVKNHLDPKYLTELEKAEIKKYKDVYYIGHKAHLRKYKQHFRDKDENYKPLVGDHIAYRFEILKILGSGAFGKVLEVLDHKYDKKYALKILKKSDELYEQFKLEVKILKIVKEHPSSNKNIVEIKGDFQFRGHICIVTEMLSMNIYSYIKAQNYQGFDIDIVRKILIQLMQALLFLHHKNIIHCDIKPENVVFKELGKSGVKLIDFGSACFASNKEFTYIQSRYYRSPEIVLMKPYDSKIDVWSLGCLIFEIYTGTPLFPSRTEDEQMQMLLATLGVPPAHFLAKCERGSEFNFANFQGKPLRMPLRERLRNAPVSMVDLVEWMVRWSPEERPTIAQCLTHEFILEGLPKVVRQQHLKQMCSPSPYNFFCKQPTHYNSTNPLYSTNPTYSTNYYLQQHNYPQFGYSWNRTHPSY